MKTTYSGETVPLNITYSGEIDVTNDVLNLYVLDKDNMRIDKYLKTSLELYGNVTITDGIFDFVIGYGKFFYSFSSCNKVTHAFVTEYKLHTTDAIISLLVASLVKSL